MVAYLSNEIQKRYQKLMFTNAMLEAAEMLLQADSGLSEDLKDLKDSTLDPHHKALTEEFLNGVHEVRALELYKAFYAGRLLQSLDTKTAIAN